MKKLISILLCVMCVFSSATQVLASPVTKEDQQLNMLAAQYQVRTDELKNLKQSLPAAISKANALSAAGQKEVRVQISDNLFLEVSSGELPSTGTLSKEKIAPNSTAEAAQWWWTTTTIWTSYDITSAAGIVLVKCKHYGDFYIQWDRRTSYVEATDAYSSYLSAAYDVSTTDYYNNNKTRTTFECDYNFSIIGFDFNLWSITCIANIVLTCDKYGTYSWTHNWGW